MTFNARSFNHGPRDSVPVNQDDNDVALEYGRLYLIDNDGVASPASNVTLDLPTVELGDRGRPIYLLTCYSNDANDPQNFGHGVVKADGTEGNQIKVAGLNQSNINLYVQDDALVLYHDGVSIWYLGN